MTSQEFIQRVCDLPAVLMVAFKVIQLIQLIDEPNVVTLDGIRKVIIADQTLTTRILKIANSVRYGVRQNIDTISQSLVIMGLKSVKIVTLFKNT